MADDGVNYASTFTITEQTGRKRRIDLTTWALPFRESGGVEFGTTQRVEVDWNPGNPNGTGQVLGPTRDPMTITGMWSDRFLKNPTSISTAQPYALAAANFIPPATLDGQPIPDALSLHLLFESICEEGQLLTVTWDEITREGFLKQYKGMPLRHQDWKWSATFEWIGKGTPSGPATLVIELDQTNLTLELANNLQAISNAAVPNGFQLAGQLADDLTAALKASNDAVVSVVNTVGNANSAVMGPVDSSAQLISTLHTVTDASQDAIASTYISVMAATAQVPDIDEVGVGKCVFYAKFKKDIRAANKVMLNAAVSNQQLLRNQNNEPAILATFVAKQGTDLRQVSTDFYGTPTMWHQLARFNGLSSSLVDVGTVINVPRLQGNQ